MADEYDGFREFFAARRPALSRAAFFLAGSESDGEDLLQDAMVKAAARWPRLRDGNPEAYVRQVMLNSVRSRWRRRQRNSENAVAELPERPVPCPTDTEDTKQLLSAALLRLTSGSGRCCGCASTRTCPHRTLPRCSAARSGR